MTVESIAEGAIIFGSLFVSSAFFGAALTKYIQHRREKREADAKWQESLQKSRESHLDTRFKSVWKAIGELTEEIDKLTVAQNKPTPARKARP